MLARIIAGAIAGAPSPNRSKRCSKKKPTATEDQAHSGRFEDRLSRLPVHRRAAAAPLVFFAGAAWHRFVAPDLGSGAPSLERAGIHADCRSPGRSDTPSKALPPYAG